MSYIQAKEVHNGDGKKKSASQKFKAEGVSIKVTANSIKLAKKFPKVSDPEI